MPALKGSQSARKQTAKSKIAFQAPATNPRPTKKRRQIVNEDEDNDNGEDHGDDDACKDNATRHVSSSSKNKVSKNHTVSGPSIQRGDSPGPGQDMAQILSLLHSQQKKKANAHAKKFERDIEAKLQEAQRDSEAISAKFEQDSEETIAHFLESLKDAHESAVNHIRATRQMFEDFQTSNLTLVDSLEKQIMHASRQRREHTNEAEQMLDVHANEITNAFTIFQDGTKGTRKLLKRMANTHHDPTELSNHMLLCLDM